MLKNDAGVAVVTPVALNILINATDNTFNTTATPRTVRLLNTILFFSG
jgi:hypothetical protein